MKQNIPLTVLDLASVREGFGEADAFATSKALIQLAEEQGYFRYWVAEHHGMAGVASSATSVLLAYLGAATSRIRLGAGGIMLPNHAPLVVAEQFGTLATLFPERVDLGLGRAPGTDMKTARALRRDLQSNVDKFPSMIAELQQYFSDSGVNGVQAVPGHGLQVPLILLGSSTYSAMLAAQLGLPFAFASHFAPENLEDAFDWYRNNFVPSSVLKEPYTMATLNVLVADDNDEAEFLRSSSIMRWVKMMRGIPGKIDAPMSGVDLLMSPLEKEMLESRMKYTFVGDSARVREQMDAFVERFAPDELVIATDVFEPAAKLRSYELLAQLWQD
ncbi:LLM class flavin-dependent oxidoreductase [Culicoidibacter larvae]|uniref:LLM class flavin-dependent oxidoreductase n=1 Tax=Culicoidibacter larvae TaxID=2579976 RepID=A0A5R8QI29_9FIRM|nr:LLM class flavin-dependent oxidoreductase [Culicoidibacter larvae]TLG77083.1 LLM class flavin-dependent oxidoreductase [Culicoidibacter larvae]